MRKTTIVTLTLVLYVAMAVFMAGIVKAYFADDDQISEPGAFSYARSYVSGDIYSGKVHAPFYRSSGWNTTAITWGSLYIEWYWYGDAYTLQHDKKDGTGYIMAEQSYYGTFGQVTCRTQAGRHFGGIYYPDTDPVYAGVPFTP